MGRTERAGRRRAAALFGDNSLDLSLPPCDAHGHIIAIPPKREVDLPSCDHKVSNPDLVDRDWQDRPAAAYPTLVCLD